MDTVKAVINVKEGVIELEGPQEFVEKYLELYRPDASKWQTAIFLYEYIIYLILSHLFNLIYLWLEGVKNLSKVF